MADLYDGRLSIWRAARLLGQLGVGARVNTGVDDVTWAVREVWGAFVGEQHPAVKAEVERQQEAVSTRPGEPDRIERMKAQAAEHARRRAEALAEQASTPDP